MRFAPGAAEMVCDFCGNREAAAPAAAPAIREIALAEGLGAASAPVEETRVLGCPSCGARVEFDPAVHSKECPFCATPVVTDTGTDRHIKPAALVPFALDERAAQAAMKAWLGSLWFAPNGLAAYARKGRRPSGIYVPFWTFDARTRTEYAGRRGDIHHVRKTVIRDGKRQTVSVPVTRWRDVRGRVARLFDDVLVLASPSLPKAHTDALAPWDLAQLIPYAPGYLSGFRAEAYRVGLEDGLREARAAMDAQIARDIRFDIGGDRQEIASAHTEVSDVTFKHVLLPIWVAAYRYRGRSFRFVVNGQTGRVQGERPYSAAKIAIAVLLMVLLLAAAMYAASVAG
jgi:hypothetical protein